MKNTFYLFGTLWGLVCIPLVAFVLLFDRVKAITGRPVFLIPIVIGYGGAIVGCIANLLIHGNLRAPIFGWLNESWNWFGKPLWALTVFGVPCAAVVGFVYSISHLLMGRYRLAK